jgi:hypothetical protein
MNLNMEYEYNVLIVWYMCHFLFCIKKYQKI